MASCGRVVKEGKHPPLKIVVSHNDKGIAFPPEVARAMFDIKLGLPTIEKRAISFDGLEVYNLCFDVSIQVVILDTVDLDESTVIPKIIIFLSNEPCRVQTYGAGSKGACLEFDYRGIWRNK
jgi:hypothetical protein